MTEVPQMIINEEKQIVLSPEEAKELLLCFRVWSNTMMEDIAMSGGVDPQTAKNMRRTSSVGRELEHLLYQNEIV